MFNLIRRISYGVIARPDRPWEEDGSLFRPLHVQHANVILSRDACI